MATTNWTIIIDTAEVTQVMRRRAVRYNNCYWGYSKWFIPGLAQSLPFRLGPPMSQPWPCKMIAESTCHPNTWTIIVDSVELPQESTPDQTEILEHPRLIHVIYSRPSPVTSLLIRNTMSRPWPCNMIAEPMFQKINDWQLLNQIHLRCLLFPVNQPWADKSVGTLLWYSRVIYFRPRPVTSDCVKWQTLENSVQY